MRKGYTYRRVALISYALLIVFIGKVDRSFAQNSAPIIKSPLKSDSVSIASQKEPNASSDSVSLINKEKIIKKSDSAFVAKRKQSANGFFTGLFGGYKKKKVQDTGRSANKKRDTANAVVKIPHIPLFQLTHGGITWSTLYTQGVSLNTGVTGMYQLAQVHQDLSLAGIPLIGEATGVMNDGQFIKEYSSYSINFDSKSFLDALEKRAENAAMNKAATEKSHLPSGQHMNLSDSMKAYDDIRAKLTSPSYQAEISACENRLKKIDDSIARSEEKSTEKVVKRDTSTLDKKIHDSIKSDTKINKSIPDTTHKSAKQDSLSEAKKDTAALHNSDPKKDSLSGTLKKDTTELHTLKEKIAQYQKLEARYEQLYQIKKNYNKLASADSSGKSGQVKLNTKGKLKYF